MKLLITDLDNTLLRNDKSISDYTISIFEKCRAQGHLLAFATARSEGAAARFIEQIKPDIIISNGGALICVRGKPIYKNLISTETTLGIIEMCKQFTGNQGLITVETDDGYFCNFHPHDADRKKVYTYTDFAFFKKSSYKITSVLENETWAKEIVNMYPDIFYLNFSGEDWRRFAAKNADKGTALQILLRHLNLSPSDVIAFGDDANDIPMLKLAGTAVAVSNSVDEVKAIANHITDSNDNDGVAKFIESALLQGANQK